MNLLIPQIARLEAKVSGYERATFGSTSRTTTARGARPATHMRRVTSPRTVAKSSGSGMKKSSSDQNLQDLTRNGPLVFSHLNTQDVMESGAYPQMPAILVSQDHGHSVHSHNSYSLPQDRSRSVQSSLDTLEGLLKQANMEMTRDSLPIILNSSASQAGDVTLNTADLNTTQPSPPQKEEHEKIAEVVNGGVDEADEEPVSSLYENLHEQLEKKKASLGMSRDKGDADSLDPERWWVVDDYCDTPENPHIFRLFVYRDKKIFDKVKNAY